MILNGISSRRILLGVTGSIAAYKAAEIVRELVRSQLSVTVIMTKNATQFITATTFRAISQNKVYVDLFDMATETAPHINLPRQSEAVLIAPATANFLAKAASGLADDLLSTVILATKKPVIICPAMNSDMFTHPAVQANLDRLRSFGYLIVEPESGPLACGDEGPGRLADPYAICECVKTALERKDLKGQRIIVTAGPTEEPIDPARFLSNRSSGKMGYSLARVANRRGAEVVLISGPTCLPKPWGVEFISVRTAEEMWNAVMSCFDKATIVIKAGAVADYMLPDVPAEKLKKKDAELILRLARTPDILKELGLRKQKQILVGFAAETGDLDLEPKRKLREKNLDLIVVNDITRPGVGFGFDTNQVKMILPDNQVIDSPLLTKEEIASLILDKILEILGNKGLIPSF